MNRAIMALVEVARGLGNLRSHTAFVGGAVIGLYLDEEAEIDIRVTDDVDCVIEAAIVPMHTMESRLREQGFSHDTSEGAPLCRWIYRGINVDIMPTEKRPYGFTNRWYAEGFHHRFPLSIQEVELHIFPLPFFMACKFEAFLDRGKGDYMMSHDWEDLVTVFAEGSETHWNFSEAPQTVRRYLREQAKMALNSPAGDEIVYAHLDRDGLERQRLQRVRRRLEELSRL